MKKLEDYTEKEKQHFDEMLEVLTEYNDRLGTKNEMPKPPYTREEMSDYSAYREKVITRECED